ncbi:MAG: Gldg family protein [Planctomycetota bacterium]|nr:Gldg family protein [Planctomycetota bacterium]
MNKQLLAISGLLLLLVLFFGVNIVAGQLGAARVDLTQGNLYTLTKGSRNIARGVDEEVRLSFYFSEQAAQGIPAVAAYGRRVVELLNEYRRASGGKVVVQVLDPEPFTEAEDDANAAGLTAQRVGGQALYMGLVGKNTTDGFEVIPFLDPSQERFLEYQVSRMIYALGTPSKPVVGLVSSLQIDGGFTFDPRTQQPSQRPAWQVMSEIRAVMQVKNLGASPKTIPDDVDVLMLVHPKDLGDDTLYAIDQFVLRGGRLLAFVDPLCEVDIPPNARSPMDLISANRTSDLGRLLDAWGVELATNKVAGDQAFGMRVIAGNEPGQQEPVTYVAWLQLPREGMNAEDAITAQATQINLATAGSISLKQPLPEGSTLTLAPLLQTSEAGALIDQSAVAFMPDPKKILADFTPGTQRLTLAARLSGMVKSAFPQGKPDVKPEEGADATTPSEGEKPHLAQSSEPATIILVADADLLDNRYWIREERLFGQIPIATKVADNGDFVVNALDNLSGSTDLISVRARGEFARPFTKVQEIQRQAEKQYLQEQQRLEDELQRTQETLAQLQANRPESDASVLLTPEQEKAIADARVKIADTRKALRRVQADLNKDIESLGTRLKLINIGLLPAAVGVAAVGIGAWRVSRRRNKVRE